MYFMLFDHSTFMGQRFEVGLVFCILCSVGVVFLDSVESVEKDAGNLLEGLEVLFTFLFLVEYSARVAAVKNPRAYVCSWFGILDALAVFPSLVAIAAGDGNSGDIFILLRLVRVLRVLRLLKVLQFADVATELMDAAVSKRRRIVVFIFIVLIVAINIGAFMYLVEGEENGFSSIPVGVYWSASAGAATIIFALTPAAGPS